MHMYLRFNYFIFGPVKLFSPAIFFIDVPGPIQGSEQIMYMCVRVSLCLSTIFRLNFRTVPTHWYFFVFHFIICLEVLKFDVQI